MSHDTNRERLFRGHTGRLCLILAGGWLVILLGREALAPLLPTIITQLSISPSLAGLALTVMWAVYALSQFPGGRLSDGLSRRTVLVASLGLTIVGFLLLTSTRTYGQFLLAVVFLGAGAGTYYPATRGLLSDLFTERRGEAVGLQISAGSIGSALSTVLAVAVITTAVWQAAFVPVIAGLVVLMYLLHRWVEEPYVLARPTIEFRTTAARLLRTSHLRVTIAIYSLFAFSWQGMISFFPTFLQFEKDLSPELASLGFGFLYVIGMVASPVAGKVSDRFGRLTVATIAIGAAFVGLTALLAASTLAPLALAVFVYAVGIRSFPAAMQTHLMDAFPDGSVAGDLGGTKTIYSGVGSLGPVYIGFVAERASYSAAFAGFCLCLLGALFLLLWSQLSSRF